MPAAEDEDGRHGGALAGDGDVEAPVESVDDAHGEGVGDPGDDERHEPQQRAAVDEDQQDRDDGDGRVEQRTAERAVDLLRVHVHRPGPADLGGQAVAAARGVPDLVDERGARRVVLSGLGRGDRVHQRGAVLRRDGVRRRGEGVPARHLGRLPGRQCPVGGGEPAVAVEDEDEVGGLAAGQGVLDLRGLRGVGARREVVDRPVDLHVAELPGERTCDGHRGGPEGDDRPGQQPPPAHRSCSSSVLCCGPHGRPPSVRVSGRVQTPVGAGQVRRAGGRLPGYCPGGCGGPVTPWGVPGGRGDQEGVRAAWASSRVVSSARSRSAPPTVVSTSRSAGL